MRFNNIFVIFVCALFIFSLHIGCSKKQEPNKLYEKFLKIKKNMANEGYMVEIMRPIGRDNSYCKMSVLKNSIHVSQKVETVLVKINVWMLYSLARRICLLI